MDNVLAVFRKDFLEVLRERRSLIFMLILPSIIVPLLVATINFLTRDTIEKATAARVDIALVGTDNLPDEVAQFMLSNAIPPDITNGRDLEKLHPLIQGMLLWSANSQPDVQFAGRHYLQLQADPRVFRKYRFIDHSNDWSSLPGPLEMYGSAYLQERIDENDASVLGVSFLATLNDIRENIENRKLHAVVVIPRGFTGALQQGRDINLHVISDNRQFRSSSGASSFIRLIRYALTWQTYYHLKERSLDIGLLKPLTIEQYSVNPKESLYLRLLPYFIVLMCFIGALYPAIDLVAGEKERNTLETLLICPVSRFEILLGKFLVIGMSGFIASLLTFLSLSITLVAGLAGGELLFGDVLSPLAVFNYLLMLIPLAALFAALLLTLSTLARNFKEAQSYIMPFNFLILIPAFYALLPGVELTMGAALTPVLNVTLALRDIWSGDVQAGIVTAIIASSSIYSLLMIGLCAWLFSRESILFRN